MRPIFVGLRMCVVMGLLMLADVVSAQNSIANPKSDERSTSKSALAKKSKSKTTFVEFELLQSDDGSGLYAQHWLKILAPLDVTLRVHRPTSEEKPELKERESGNLRYVTAIGTLDRSGKITFPDRAFAVGDTNKLKEWIEELRTYGVQGTPAGKPLWGLTKAQFTLIFDGMLKPVDFDTHELPLSKVAARLPLPIESPLRWNSAATELLARRGEQTKLKVELNGFSAATALAIALSENGLGFRPNRTPAGDIELLIEPRNSKFEQWPVGWPLQIPTFKAAPKLFAMVPIELAAVELSDVINAASKLTDIPIIIDYSELESQKLDPARIEVSFPRKTTTWHLALNRIMAPKRLINELWQDEAGRVFVWITSSRVGRSIEPEKPKP